jgi:hypothetical protein
MPEFAIAIRRPASHRQCCAAVVVLERATLDTRDLVSPWNSMRDRLVDGEVQVSDHTGMSPLSAR